MSPKWVARFFAFLAAVVLGVAFGPIASAQGPPAEDTGGGQSTPGVIVTAENPGTSPQGSGLRITMTAHSEPAIVANPDCRPATATRPPPTLRCWGSLALSVPAGSDQAAGLVVTGFQEVHKVSVGETSCGDDQGGDCDGDESGGCEGGGGCEEGGMAATADAEPVVAHVNGIARVVVPGDTNLTFGQSVQVHITLYDYGAALYKDQVLVQVRPKEEMQNTVPWTYESGPQTIQQVRVHYVGDSA